MRRRWFPERTTSLLVPTLLGALLATSLLIVARPWVNSDGRAYYGMTLSLVTDGDLDISNQRAEVGDAWFVPRTGKWVRQYPPGFAVFYWPWLKAADELGRTWNPARRANLIVTGKGWLLGHGFALLAGSLFYGGVAFAFTYLLGRLLMPPAMSFTMAAVCFLASHLVGYIAGWPSFAHSLDAALVSLGLWLILPRVVRRHECPWLWWASGLVIGAAAGIRFANAALVVGLLLLAVGLSGSLRCRLARAGLVVVGVAPWAAMVVWYEWTMKGSLFAAGYGHVMLSWPRYLFHFLALPPNGLLQWSPVLAFAVAGWWLIPAAALRRSVLVVFGCFVIMLGCFGAGTHGAGFGARYLVHFVALYALGLGQFWMAAARARAPLRVGGRAVVVMTTAYSLLLIPVAWLDTPSLALDPDTKSKAGPHRILEAAANDWFSGKPSGLRTPNLSVLGALTGRLDLPGEAWLRSMRQSGATGALMPSLPTAEHSGTPGLRRFSLPRETWSHSTVSVLLHREEAVPGAVVGLASGPSLGVRPPREGRWTCEREGLQLLATPDPRGLLVYLVAPPGGMVDTLEWWDPQQAVSPVSPDEALPRAMDFTVASWAACGRDAVEGHRRCRKGERAPWLHAGPYGDVWAWELDAEPLAWVTDRVARPEAGVILVLELGYKGAPSMDMSIGGCDLGRVELSPPETCFRTFEGGHLWLTGVDRHGRWRYRTLVVVLPGLRPAAGRGLDASAVLRDPSGGDRAILVTYGDSWRRLRRRGAMRVLN
jgi:hypothetical protein